MGSTTPRPSRDSVAFEDNMNLQWTIQLTSEPGSEDGEISIQREELEAAGFVSLPALGFETGPNPLGRQLILLLPSEEYDIDKGAPVGLALGVYWWNPATPAMCELVNRAKLPGREPTGCPIAWLVAMNTKYTAVFDSLFYHYPSTADRPSLSSAIECPPSSMEGEEGNLEETSVRVEDTDYRRLGAQQKKELGTAAALNQSRSNSHRPKTCDRMPRRGGNATAVWRELHSRIGKATYVHAGGSGRDPTRDE